MYIVSCIDLLSVTMCDPIGKYPYINIRCITRVYRSRDDYCLREESCIGFLAHSVKIPNTLFQSLHYEDSPLYIEYTTLLSGLKYDEQYSVMGDIAGLEKQVHACHKRYVEYFNYLGRKEEEKFKTMELFECVRKTMPKIKLS